MKKVTTGKRHELEIFFTLRTYNQDDIVEY